MKRIALIGLIVVMTAAFAKAEGNVHENDYLVTKTDTVFCEKVSEGLTSIIAKTQKGVKRFKPTDVVMYRSGDNFYVKHQLPGSKKEVFMKLVGRKWNLRLFKYTHYTGAVMDKNGRISSQNDRYFVFEKGRFNLELNEKNADHMFAVFGIKTKSN